MGKLRIPVDLQALERAIGLLGNRAQGASLKPKARRELEALVGLYPDTGQAVAWKRKLRQIRTERLARAEGAPIRKG